MTEKIGDQMYKKKGEKGGDLTCKKKEKRGMITNIYGLKTQKKYETLEKGLMFLKIIKMPLGFLFKKSKLYRESARLTYGPVYLATNEGNWSIFL